MDFGNFGITGIAAITVICWFVGQAVKSCSINNKWIPVTVGTTGAILGIVGKLIMPDFPAEDFITAIAVGIVSGFAATGVNEAVNKLKKGDKNGD